MGRHTEYTCSKTLNLKSVDLTITSFCAKFEPGVHEKDIWIKIRKDFNIANLYMLTNRIAVDNIDIARTYYFLSGPSELPEEELWTFTRIELDEPIEVRDKTCEGLEGIVGLVI